MSSELCLTSLQPKRNRPCLPREFFARLYEDTEEPGQRQLEDEEEVDVTCESGDEDRTESAPRLLQHQPGPPPVAAHWSPLQLVPLEPDHAVRVQHIQRLADAFREYPTSSLILTID